FQGDRSHFYDQLVDRGVPVSRTVGICYMLAAVFAGVAWIGAIDIARLGWSVLLYAALIAVMIALLIRHGFVRVDRPRETKPDPPDVSPGA
ncbi:MAG: hypothetical protein PHU85_06040, partial [Phycisphaerae bacterium]|nr:hypothetical protein [Phycisphaerae bacterium]